MGGFLLRSRLRGVERTRAGPRRDTDRDSGVLGGVRVSLGRMNWRGRGSDGLDNPLPRGWGAIRIFIADWRSLRPSRGGQEPVG